MDFFKNGFCNRRGPHNQGCLFRHDEIEGQGKIESAKTETGAEVLVFKAEAMGWNGQRAVEKQGFSDVAQAARDWAKSKLREQEARPATLLAGGVAPVPGKAAAAAAAAAAPHDDAWPHALPCGAARGHPLMNWAAVPEPAATADGQSWARPGWG